MFGFVGANKFVDVILCKFFIIVTDRTEKRSLSVRTAGPYMSANLIPVFLRDLPDKQKFPVPLPKKEMGLSYCVTGEILSYGNSLLLYERVQKP